MKITLEVNSRYELNVLHAALILAKLACKSAAPGGPAMQTRLSGSDPASELAILEHFQRQIADQTEQQK